MLSISRSCCSAAYGLVLSFASFSLLSGCGEKTTGVSVPLAGAAATDVSTAPLLGFVTNGASAYWVVAHGGVNKAAAELKNVQVQFVMPGDGSAATQKQDVDDLVAKGVKAIAISPVDPSNQTGWINAIAAKVPVITQDSDAPNSKRLCYIGSDNHAAGVMCGNLIKRALPRGGKIILFVGVKDTQNAHDRIQGIKDSVQGSNIQVLDVRTDNTDQALAKTNATDALIAHSDLAAEVGIWSYNGPAIASAIQDAGKAGKVKVICFDQEKATLSGIKRGVIYGTIVQDPYQFGYRATKMLARLAAGDKSVVPASGAVYVPTTVVDSKNVDVYSAELARQEARS